MAPLDLLSRIIRYYTGNPEQDLPIVSTSAAVGLSILYTLIYVIPFYLSSKTRPSPELSRDAPSVIRARIRLVSCSCVLICAITVYVALQYGQFTTAQLLRTFGWWPSGGLDIIKSLLLVALLFSGPLFERAFIQGEWRDWISGRSLADTFSSYIGWRTYVAGPVSEEFVWRSMVIPLHLFAKLSPTNIVFVTPLYFGIAHVHHCYEFKLTHPNTPLLPAILRSLFQFTYTSLFGFYAAFLFLRTGNLWTAILAHSFCNWMGLPRFWGRVEPPVPVSPTDVSRKDDINLQPDDGVPDSPEEESRLHIGWTVAYYAWLVFGAVAFYRNLYNLTTSEFALVPNWP